MKKIINDPQDFVDEMVDGLLLAHDDELRAADEDRRALVRIDAGTGGRVGIVTGGGSGHLPLFLGYVGTGLCSGVAVGNVFSSPSPEQILAATLDSDDGAGVLYLYGNYGGDVYNFDIAGDMAGAQGVRTTTVVGTDDILSAPPEKAHTRRGVAGIFFAYKAAGASAERGDDLDTVTRIAQHAVNRTRTMGVGLSPTILPAAGEPTFTLEEGEMEVGVGIHGEPGHHRGAIEPADDITDRFLTELFKELPVGAGDRVAVLVNGLGSTPLEELYLIYRRVHRALVDRGATIHRKYIGEYATSLEMAGASLSIIHLDDELAELIDAPARSPFFTQGSVELPKAEAGKPRARVTTEKAAREIRTTPTPGRLRDVVLAAMGVMTAHTDELRDLDAAVGDGDLGITVGSGARAVHDAVAALPADAHPGEVFAAAGPAFAAANPSTFAALLGGGILAASQALAESDSFGPAEAATALAAAIARIQERGGAAIGDKTVIDVMDAVRLALVEGRPPAEAAATAVQDGTDRASVRGRAGWLGERTIGQRDPGSVAFQRLVEAVVAAL